MGYTVEFLSLNWQDLIPAFRGDQPGLHAAVVASNSESPMWNSAGRGFETIQALSDLLGGDLGKDLVRNGAESQAEALRDVSDGHASAMLGLLRHLGAHAGEAVHNSKAGPHFRDHFLEQTLASAIASFEWYLLVDRPLFGLSHSGYPTWGGMTASECRAIAKSCDLDAIAEIDDSDEQD